MSAGIGGQLCLVREGGFAQGGWFCGVSGGISAFP